MQHRPHHISSRSRTGPVGASAMARMEVRSADNTHPAGDASCTLRYQACNHRFGSTTAKSYLLSQFGNAFARYTPSDTGVTAVTGFPRGMKNGKASLSCWGFGAACLYTRKYSCGHQYDGKPRSRTRESRKPNAGERLPSNWTVIT
jgi:hypothetical protein